MGAGEAGYNVYTLYIHYIYTLYTLYIHYIYTIYTLYIHHIEEDLLPSDEKNQRIQAVVAAEAAEIAAKQAAKIAQEQAKLARELLREHNRKTKENVSYYVHKYMYSECIVNV